MTLGSSSWIGSKDRILNPKLEALLAQLQPDAVMTSKHSHEYLDNLRESVQSLKSFGMTRLRAPWQYEQGLQVYRGARVDHVDQCFSLLEEALSTHMSHSYTYEAAAIAYKLPRISPQLLLEQLSYKCFSKLSAP